MNRFNFLKTTFGRIFVAVTLTVIIVLSIVGMSTFRQVNLSINDYMSEQQNFLRGQGLWAKIVAVENIKKYEDITNNFKDSIFKSIIQSSIIGLSAGVLVSLIISDQITKPISRLKDVVKNVSGNNYKEKVKLEGSSEIRELICEFNNLIDELERIEKLREDLVSDVSHELKTPLTKVRGLLEGVLDDVYSLDKESLKKILSNVEQLEYLIERLQSLVQIKSGNQKLNLEKIKVRSLVEDIVLGFSGKEITLVIDVDSKLRLSADEKMFREILDNLVNNAYKYTNSGQIKIYANSHNLKVSDTGIGIPKKDIPYIFERFYRVDKSRSKQTGGLGLGLSIVKDLVDAHGWKVSVESETDKGTVVTITF